jgi:hypothetical protein
MRIAASLAIALATLVAGEAHAERRDCEVLFVRAPDDVRLVIESWLKAEPRCSGTIELRVVETESGTLYLIAQRPDGRIHEREVPDAQSAGVLVASWVADDWTSTPPADEAPPTVEPLTVNPFEGAPGVTDALPPPTPVLSTGRWFSVGAMIAMEGMGGVGARFEMDLFGGRSSKWTLGVSLAGVSSMTHVVASEGFGYVDSVDLRALFVASRTWRLGQNWNVRWSFGLGPMYTDATATINEYFMPEMTYSADGVSLTYESTLTLAREMFDHRIAITAGPTASLISQELKGDGDQPEMSRSDIDLMFLVAARYRL